MLKYKKLRFFMALLQVSEVSDTELKFGGWFITYKSLLKKIGIGLLIAVDVFFIVYVLISSFITADYLFVQYKRMINSMLSLNPNYEYFTPNPVQPLAILDTYVISNNNYYDFVAEVRNSNTDWAVESVTYRFTTENNQTPEATSFVLPNDTKNLMVLGYEAETTVSGADLEIIDIQYQRVRNFDEVEQLKTEILINDPVFVSDSVSDITEKIPVSEARFNVENTSINSYWDVGFEILLYRGNRVIGANYMQINSLAAKESRDLRVKWYNNVGAVSRVEVNPNVNFVDQGVYRKIESEIPELR